MRIIHKLDRFLHTSLLFHDMFSLKFVDIVKLKSLQIMHKAYHNCLPKTLQSYFVLNKVDNTYKTRAAVKFKIRYARTSLKSKLVSVVGPKLWNELPKSITCFVNITKFEQKTETLSRTYLFTYRLVIENKYYLYLIYIGLHVKFSEI